MKLSQAPHRPLLFVLRLWLAEAADGGQEWRGVIENEGREKRYFREWQVLLDFLQSSCQAVEQEAERTDDLAGFARTSRGEQDEHNIG